MASSKLPASSAAAAPGIAEQARPKDQCVCCTAWRQKASDPVWGGCHAEVKLSASGFGVFPVVHCTHWCRKFEPTTGTVRSDRITYMPSNAKDDLEPTEPKVAAKGAERAA